MERLQDDSWVPVLGNYPLEKLLFILKDQGLLLCEAFIDLPKLDVIQGLKSNSIPIPALLITIVCLIGLYPLMELSLQKLETKKDLFLVC